MPYIPSHTLLYTPFLDAAGSVPSNSQSEARTAEQALLKHCHWLTSTGEALSLASDKSDWTHKQTDLLTLPIVSLLFAGNKEQSVAIIILKPHPSRDPTHYSHSYLPY